MIASLHVDTSRTWRGGQSQVRFLVVGLRGMRHRVGLVAHPEGELYPKMSEGGDLFPLPTRSEIDLSAAWKLSRFIRDFRPDVVHAHDPHAVATAATALAITSPTPRPVLVASRRIEFRIGHNSFSRWKYGQVDCFIAVSGAVRDRLVADGIPRAKVEVVHDGVDVDRIARLPAESVHAAFYLPTHAPVVGNIGALVAQKAQHHLIDAAAIVVRSVPDVRFVILGDGELRQSLEEQIKRKHLERHVFLGGFREDAVALLKSFDVFALSSVYEGMCTSLIDAMAASKASVATEVGGVPEVMIDGETGFLVPARDDARMAERIIELLGDEALRIRMGRAAFDRAQRHFTVDHMVKGTARVYKTLLPEGRGRQ